MTSKLPSWLFLFLSLLVLLGASEAQASTGERTINSISQLRSQNWAASDILHVASYYDGQHQGGGDFQYLPAGCAGAVTGDLLTSSTAITNLSGPVYVGEGITSAGRFPANTTISAIGFKRVLSAGIWTNASTTITSIPDTTNIVPRMSVNGVRIAVGTKVATVTAPSTVITAHGSIHNGRVITITSTTGTILVGMYVTAIANNDTLPKVLPDSVAVPGLVTVSSVVGSTVTTTGSLGLAGVATDVTFHFTSTDGAVTISLPTTGAEASTTPLLFFQNNATASASSIGTNNTSAITLNGDDGGVHILDNASHCYVRTTGSPDVLGWGAVPDNSTDSTGFLQNDITYNSQSTQPGPAGGVQFPAGITGIFKASELFVFKPVPFIGQGLETSILQQLDGQAAQTPLVYFFSLYDETNLWNANYLPMGVSWRNMTLRGPIDVANTIGLYLDGYNGNPQPPDSDSSRAFLQEFQVDQFKGFGIYGSRLSGVVPSLYKVQVHGITSGAGSNDCIHADGSNTWGIYYVITSACDSGLYLQSPTSWSFFRAVAFSNNHAATITGTTSSDTNNAQLNLGDFEFGFNFQNAIVVDSQGLRINCDKCRVNDTGQVSTVNTFSDIEITSNAAVANGPVLILAGDYFTGVHSEFAQQNHLNNITFDSGASATVSVDANTTTSSATSMLSTNLATCSCTSFLNGPYPTENTLRNASDALTAHSGGGQASATIIATDLARFTTVAANLDSAQLPAAFKGMDVIVKNSGVSNMAMFARNGSTDTINGIAGSTGITQPPGVAYEYLSYVTGQWHANVLSPTSQYVPYITASGLGGSSGADTTEDVLATIPISANAESANGCLEFDGLFTFTASTNAKTVRVYLGTTGTTAYMNAATAGGTVVTTHNIVKICNANATNSQIGGINTGAMQSNGTVALTTGAIDTTLAHNLIITGQKASAGEVLTLSEYNIRVEPHS